MENSKFYNPEERINSLIDAAEKSIAHDMKTIDGLRKNGVLTLDYLPDGEKNHAGTEKEIKKIEERIQQKKETLFHTVMPDMARMLPEKQGEYTKKLSEKRLMPEKKSAKPQQDKSEDHDPQPLHDKYNEQSSRKDIDKDDR